MGIAEGGANSCLIFVGIFCQLPRSRRRYLRAASQSRQADDDGRHSQVQAWLQARAADQRRRHARRRPEPLDRKPPRRQFRPARQQWRGLSQCLTRPLRQTAIRACWRRSPAARQSRGGLFYDDSYDRTEYPSKAFYTSQGLPDPGCTGTPGTEVTNFEALDKSYNFSTQLVADITGGGTIGQVYTQLDPDNMQRRLVNGKCVPVYPARICPHQHDLRSHQGRRHAHRLVRQASGLRRSGRSVRQWPRRTLCAGNQFAGHARSRRQDRRRLHHQLHRRAHL